MSTHGFQSPARLSEHCPPANGRWRKTSPSQQLALSPAPNSPLLSTPNPLALGSLIHPRVTRSKCCVPASARCQDHRGQEKPKPLDQAAGCQQQIRPPAVPRIQKGLGGALSLQFCPTLGSRQRPSTSPHQKQTPARPGLLIGPLYSCPRGSEGARGLVKVTQQSCPGPRPAPCSPCPSLKPRCFLHLLHCLLFFLPPPLTLVTASDCDLDRVREVFFPHSLAS